MAISLGGGGSASVINETIDINSAENLITLDDGRVYLKGGVTETGTTAYPDATAGIAYTGTSFSVSSQSSNPADVTFDGTAYYYVIDSNSRTVFKYNYPSGTYNSSFSVSSQTTFPMGLVWDGTHICVSDSAGVTPKVYKYTTTGTYVSNFSADANGTSYNASMRGIAWDGTNFWIVSDGFNRVYKYNQAGVYQNFSFSVASQEATAQGIVWDGSHLYVIGNSNNSFMKYGTDGTFLEHMTSVYPQDTAASGLGYDGTHFLVSGKTNDSVFKYQYQIGVVSETVTPLTKGKQNYVRIK